MKLVSCKKTLFWSKNCLISTPTIRLLKDKSVAKGFTTAFHKVKSNLGACMPVCMSTIMWV